MDSVQVQTFYTADQAGAIGQSQDKAAQRLAGRRRWRCDGVTTDVTYVMDWIEFETITRELPEQAP
jgi:hypothetical protein